MSESTFSHLTPEGDLRMVNVGLKPIQKRRAKASVMFQCQPETLDKLKAKAIPKGDVLAAARLAGIMAAKRTDELIPLCHTLPLSGVEIDFTLGPDGILIESTVHTEARTGVEMEALAAASIAALTLYDMCKAVDKSLRITDLHLVEKIKE
jgi:cyclic pyranopterin phosphate synthase